MTDIAQQLRILAEYNRNNEISSGHIIDLAADEIERLSKYEITVKRIAWDYIELSHDKAYNQRDEYIRWCRATIQKDKDHHG